MPVPSVGPEVRKMRPACELMTIPVGSTGLTAKLEPPVKGHWPAPVAGLSPGCNRPLVRLISAPPGGVHLKKSEASEPSLMQHGHLYQYSEPEPVWSVATPAPSPRMPLHFRLPLSSKCGSDCGKPSSWALP